MDKEVLFELYSKMFYLREFEKLIMKSFLNQNIKKLPTSYYNLEGLVVALSSISDASDYLFSTDRIHPYYILRHNKIERGIKKYFQVLKSGIDVTDNELRAFSFNDAPERIFNIMRGMASSYKETGFLPTFVMTVDSKHAMLSQFLESVVFSIANSLQSVYIIERTKNDDLTILNNILDSHYDKILKIEVETNDIFKLRSTLHRALRSAKEYHTPSVVICNAFNSTCPIEFLENKILSLKLSLNELKDTLNKELNYLVSEDLKEFLNVA